MKSLFFAVFSILSISAQAATPVYGSIFMALGAGHDNKVYFGNIAKVAREVTVSGYKGDSSALLSQMSFDSAMVEGSEVTYHYHWGYPSESGYCGVNLSFTNSPSKSLGVSGVKAQHLCQALED
jgi:hypothetical protein